MPVTAAELDRRKKILDKHFEAVKEAKAEMDTARKAFDRTVAAYRRAIKDAFAGGMPARMISIAAGISKDRCYQIKDDRRT